MVVRSVLWETVDIELGDTARPGSVPSMLQVDSSSSRSIALLNRMCLDGSRGLEGESELLLLRVRSDLFEAPFKNLYLFEAFGGLPTFLFETVDIAALGDTAPDSSVRIAVEGGLVCCTMTLPNLVCVDCLVGLEGASELVKLRLGAGSSCPVLRASIMDRNFVRVDKGSVH